MAYRSVNLGDVDDGASGSVFGIGEMKDCTVTVGGTFTGTWTVQLSHDGGTTWATYATSTTAAIVPTQTAGTERLPRAGHIKCTLGSGSGTAKFRLGGVDENAVG